MRQHELEAEQQRGGERGELERRLAAREERDATAPTTSSTSSTCCTTCRSGIPRRGTGPSPRARTATRGRAASRACGPRRRAPRASGFGSSSSTENASERRDGEAGEEAEHSAAGRARPGTTAQSGATSSGANFVQPASARNAPRAQRRPSTSQKPQIRNAGRIASFVFDLDAYCVNGYAAHANASVAASRLAAEAPARRARGRRCRARSKSDRREVRRGQVVPLAGPAEERVPREVGDVRRPARRCRRAAFADSQRPFVWMRSRISPSASAGPHGFRSSSTGKWPYGASPWTIRSAPITPA